MIAMAMTSWNPVIALILWYGLLCLLWLLVYDMMCLWLFNVCNKHCYIHLNLSGHHHIKWPSTYTLQSTGTGICSVEVKGHKHVIVFDEEVLLCDSINQKGLFYLTYWFFQSGFSKRKKISRLWKRIRFSYSFWVASQTLLWFHLLTTFHCSWK